MISHAARPHATLAITETNRTATAVGGPFFIPNESYTRSFVLGIAGEANSDSEAGKGTTFRIDLPRVEGRTEASHLLTEVPALPPGTKTILLVEDEDVDVDRVRPPHIAAAGRAATRMEPF